MEGCPDSPRLPGVPQGLGAGPNPPREGGCTGGAALDVRREPEWERPVGVFCPSIQAAPAQAAPRGPGPPPAVHCWPLGCFPVSIHQANSFPRTWAASPRGRGCQHTAWSEKHKPAPGSANCVVSTSPLPGWRGSERAEAADLNSFPLAGAGPCWVGLSLLVKAGSGVSRWAGL